MIIHPYEGFYRGSSPFSSKGGKGLNPLIFHKKSRGKNLGSNDSPLASPALNADLNHLAFPRSTALGPPFKAGTGCITPFAIEFLAVSETPRLIVGHLRRKARNTDRWNDFPDTTFNFKIFMI
jgi:hypothetical protein